MLDSSKVAISRGVFDWYFVRGPTGDVWFQKCCNHQRSGVPSGFFRKMQIMRLPTLDTHISNRLETGWSKVDAGSVSKTLPNCSDREADKMIAELRNYGPVWWPVGLKFGTLGTCTVSLIHQYIKKHRKTMKHQQLLADTYRCHITATTHNKEAWKGRPVLAGPELQTMKFQVARGVFNSYFHVWVVS